MSHLTTNQLEDLRRRLLDARESVQALLAQGSSGNEPIEASGKTIGRLTRMDAIQVQAMTQLSRHQLDVRLKQIDASLAEWEVGRYGVCRYCKGPIGWQRLEALPEAPFCIACQESFEV